MARLAAACAALLVASSCASAVPEVPASATARPTAAGTASPVAASARPTTTPEKPLVIAADRFFILAETVVKVGTIVTWRNDGQEVHNIFANDGSFHSPDLASGNAFSWTFTRPGRYAYLCTYHAGDGMYGAVDVR